jgi:hypothetical protein
MKASYVVFGCLLCAVSLSSCCASLIPGRITGSGRIVTQDYDLDGFDQVEIQDGFQAQISAGDSFAVQLEIDENLVDHLDVLRMGSTLTIRLKPTRSYSLGNVTRKALVTMPRLVGVESSGGSQVDIHGFRSIDDLSAYVSGGGHLSGDIEAGDLEFVCSGGSHLTLAGAGGELTLEASGGSQVDLADFDVGDASIEASGGSRVTIDVSGRLDVEASGGSQVYYEGNPTLGEIDTSGGSSVQHK